MRSPVRDFITYLLTAIIAILLLTSMSGCAQTNQAQSPKPTSTPSIPKSATVVNQASDVTGWEVGDIQVTFTDGHTELFTKNEKCGRPHVSGKGDVGWSVWNDFTTDDPDDRYHHTSETLRLRLRDGTIKNFKPNEIFITDWGFVDDDSAVVIASMEHHGSTSFIKYDIATGRELGSVDYYVPYDQLPKWAQPYSDEKP
jgi:hypothetical protein